MKIAARAYFIGLLMLGTVVSTLPQFALAIVLLILQLYTTLKPAKPPVQLALTMATLIFTPLTLISFAGDALSALIMIPGVYLLDLDLQGNASVQLEIDQKPGKNPTPLLKKTASTLLVILFAAAVLSNLTLALAASTLLIYLAAVLTYTFRRIPKNPMLETKTWSRMLVGDTQTSEVTLTTTGTMPLTAAISPTVGWVKVEPTKLTLKSKTQTPLHLSFTPPLAGPTKLQLKASTLEPHGLIQINQTLEPLELHIIPRAQYAQWLAQKYLEQTDASAASTTASLKGFRASKLGLEYFGNRLYQPGDRLKDVDWKHTLKFKELVVKEYAGAMGQPVIIVADLSVQNAEDADKLAYNLVMTALTLAAESLPSGLAAYNQTEVLATLAPADPKTTLKKTLQITEKITITPQPQKMLAPTQIRQLKRTLNQICESENTQTQALAAILEFEVAATQSAAKNRPATVAIAKCIGKTPAPATITVTSQMAFDADALVLTLENLKARGYVTVQVPA